MEKRSGSPKPPEKLTEAVLYLCQQSSEDPDFGEAKLVKLLYFADCDALERRGTPITGSTYLHLPNGPFPQDWDTVMSGMKQGGDIAVQTENGPGGYGRKRARANRTPRPGVLSEEETASLDRQIARFAQFNAGEIVSYSRRGLGWRATGHRGPVPHQGSRFRAPVKDGALLEEAERVMDEEAKRRDNPIGSRRHPAGRTPKTCRNRTSRLRPGFLRGLWKPIQRGGP